MRSLSFCKWVLYYVCFPVCVVWVFLMFINYLGKEDNLDVEYIDFHKLVEEYDNGDLPKKPMKTKIMKTILLWSQIPDSQRAQNLFGEGRNPFIGEHQCPVDNCIITNDRTLMGEDEFDVVAFYIWGEDALDLPSKRSPRQFYAFTSVESPAFFNMSDVRDDVFNWTVTFRLDSDFVWPHFKVTDLQDNVVAPGQAPQWVDPNGRIVDAEQYVPTLDHKHKKVAWFLSYCSITDRQAAYVEELKKYIDVDIYGKCGNFTCPSGENECYDILKEEYFFYLAFESSSCFDYITDKAVNALSYDTVPIVYGGADYSQFLPPNSYIDAKKYEPKDMAELLNWLIDHKDEYANLFYWKPFYKFHKLGVFEEDITPYLHPFCEMCAVLQEAALPSKSYNNIKSWWLGDNDTPVCEI